MKKNLSVFLSFLFIFLCVFSGCGSDKKQAASATEKTTAKQSTALEISGAGINVKLSDSDMQKREQTSFKTSSTSSSGEVTESQVEGFSLTQLLKEKGVTQAKLTSITFIASDGYTIMVPAELFTAKDIYIALKMDGKALENPRSVIPDSRTMYWARDLIKVQIEQDSSSASQTEQVSRAIMFRQAALDMDAKTLTYTGSKTGKKQTVPSYSLKTFAKTYMKKVPTAPINMVALDGFKKSDTAKVFLGNYISLKSDTVDGLPRYWSESIGAGMHLQKINTAVSGTDAVYFGSEMKLSDLFKEAGMADADNYNFIAADDYTVKVPVAAISYGKVYFDESAASMRVSFSGYNFGSNKDAGNIKDLLYIEAITG